jgi:flagellar hook-associated protein 2
MTRPSNKITDAIPGVDLELFVPTASAVTVNVARDTAPVKTAIEDMVNAYNAFLGVVDALSDRENAADDGTGSLAGNFALRTIKTQIRRMMTSVSSTPGDNVSVLGDLGIEFELSGQMKVDGTKLQAKLDSSFDDVAKFFSANTDQQTTTGTASRGLAGDMVKYLADQTSSTGVIKSQEDTLKQSQTRYEAQLEALDLRMEQIRDPVHGDGAGG